MSRLDPFYILTITHNDVCEAWEFMRHGASLEAAAASIGVRSRDLNWWLNHYLGAPKEPFHAPTQPEPMF